jgi:hypothetical protein
LIHFYKRLKMVKKGKTPPVAETEVEEVETVEAPVDAPENGAEEEPAVIEAPVNKKKKAAAAAEKENGSTEESTDAPAEAAVNGSEEKKDAEDGEKKKTPKPVKKVVPAWASISEEARKNLSKSKLPKPKVQDAVLAAMAACADSKGVVSAGSIRKFVLEENPDLPKMVLKKAVAKAIERGLIKQVKGKGFAGSFKLESSKNVAKASKTAKSKGDKAAKVKLPPLENDFPGVFTWACNPKEASIPLIRKYLVKHYPELNVEENPKQFRKALESGESKGQLRRVTGQGFNGTFALVDEADKTGAKFEDALENAIIAMSEPKQVSVNSLRDYLSVYHQEYNTDQRPTVLKSALDRAVAKGWLKQISGKGFAGTYRLMHPYYPSPRELWGTYFVEKKEKEEPTTPKRKAAKRAAPESDSEEEEDSDDEGEVLPSPKKRGAPTPRKTVAPVKKVAKKVAAKKSKPAPKPKKGKKKSKK